MIKGASIKFSSYKETIPKLLKLLGLDKELKKHHSIVLKPTIRQSVSESTKVDFVEPILKFCIQHKNPIADIFIAEGSDGHDTMSLFQEQGYQKLAEANAISLLDLNSSETQEIEKPSFLKFSSIKYPKILLDSFVISLPQLGEDSETEIAGSLSSMLSAFPSEHYKGFFSRSKTKIRKWPIKYSVHDIIQCKIPEFAIIDSSQFGIILAGRPLEIDKQAAKILDIDWKTIAHLKLINESITEEEKSDTKKDLSNQSTTNSSTPYSRGFRRTQAQIQRNPKIY